MFTYMRPVNAMYKLSMTANSAKGFGFVVINISYTKIMIPLCPSYYMPQNPHNTISQTALRYYNQFRIVRAEACRWIQITIDTWIKLKVETEFKERYQQLFDFITIDVLHIEEQHTSDQYIITLPMTPIINRFSINTPCRGISFISVYFTLLTVSWNKCSIIKH